MKNEPTRHAEGASSVVPPCTCQKTSGPLDDFGKVDPDCPLHGDRLPEALRERVQAAVAEATECDTVELRLAADALDKGMGWFKDGAKVRAAAEEIIRLRRENERHRAHNWIAFCDFLATHPTEDEMTAWSDDLDRRAAQAERLIDSAEWQERRLGRG